MIAYNSFMHNAYGYANPLRKYYGFYAVLIFVILVVGSLLYLLAGLIRILVKYINKKWKEHMLQKELEQEKERERQVAIKDLIALIEDNNYTIYEQIVKSSLDKDTAELTNYSNLLVFSKTRGSIINVNGLVNHIMKFTLNLDNRKSSTTKGAIITSNYNMDLIQDKLVKETGVPVKIRMTK